MTLVYLDTETTGLNPQAHDVWEIAYAVDDGPVLSSFVDHDTLWADPKALEINGYHQRFTGDPYEVGSIKFEVDLIAALDGATLVGANPAFDAAFLRARWGSTPWRYRLLDVEAYAMGALGLDEPKGLSFVREQLVARGFDIPAPDHTAAADVVTLRACHQALRSIYGGGA